MRLVVDTSVMVRALMSAGPARQFYKTGLLHHDFLFHNEQLLELRDVAARPRINVDVTVVQGLIDRLRTHGTEVSCSLDSVTDCRDPNDNYLLAIASAGQAEVIISEDRDLLALHPWRGIHVLRLFEFLEKYPLPADFQP